ncbi:4-hydroxybenzoyl-CoA reductase subunit gamma [Marinomonas aquimarina]|uniref:4-hydroxybenzoyl-CoA reductase subunit gamma n=1 Tax=Marinomonas aquimarina TaxID=295068 RepID=A0A1A8TDD5_9GAMM|nr:xanthine dehydrogenase small subunit [Marinomonas aquimarina]SBS29749.1 4-hydroxybenzoyl-CoA reductase subunit gamma [Marinomonas aquimarina]
MIRFLLNDREVCLENSAPEMTVLEYLRTKAEQRGSKEGCASGDCGACTVVVAEVVKQRLRYRTLNSCITLVGSLHGKQLLTVEHLQQHDALHPVQQAMVDQHGSQCGFCTPGFIMSLFCLYRNDHQPTRAEVERALAGNLCRCTGYRPIIDAALSLAGQGVADALAQQEAAVATRLTDMLQQPISASMQAGQRHFLVPTSSDELLAQLTAHPKAQLVAGGTDFSLTITQQLQQPDTLIYTGRVAELTQIEESEQWLKLGAALSYTDVEPLLQQHFPSFARLLERLGSLQVRNQGTLGGNIANASPIGDTPPVLLALDAILHLRSPAGRHTMPIAEFFTGYRQTKLPTSGFIEAIEIPLQPERQLYVYKISKRLDDDISAVCAAFSIELKDGVVQQARLGFGGMAATPARAFHAEQALLGQPFSEQGIEAAQQALAQDFSPIDDVRASGAYRLQVAQNLLLRAVLEQDNPTAEALEVVQYA